VRPAAKGVSKTPQAQMGHRLDQRWCQVCAFIVWLKVCQLCMMAACSPLRISPPSSASPPTTYQRRSCPCAQLRRRKPRITNGNPNWTEIIRIIIYREVMQITYLLWRNFMRAILHSIQLRSVQIFGSYAYRKSNRVARHFLDSRAITIDEGTNEVLELKTASKILGGNYRAY